MAPRGPTARSAQRLESPGAIEVDHRVELVGETSLEVVALTLGLGTVDDPDRALEPGHAEGITNRGGRGGEPEALCNLVEEGLVTARERGARGAHAKSTSACTTPADLSQPCIHFLHRLHRVSSTSSVVV